MVPLSLLLFLPSLVPNPFNSSETFKAYLEWNDFWFFTSTRSYFISRSHSLQPECSSYALGFFWLNDFHLTLSYSSLPFFNKPSSTPPSARIFFLSSFPLSWNNPWTPFPSIYSSTNFLPSWRCTVSLFPFFLSVFNFEFKLSIGRCSQCHLWRPQVSIKENHHRWEEFSSHQGW